MPAVVPERRSARAKMMPAAFPMERESKAWMPKMSASSAPETPYREAPATIRMALLTKSAKVNRDMASSAIEYGRQVRMADRAG